MEKYMSSLVYIDRVNFVLIVPYKYNSISVHIAQDCSTLKK